jgi:LmbE family N-acetylglucosaminyl deacetylase
MRRHLLVVVASLVVAVGVPLDWTSAQMRVVPVDEQHGHVALGLALRHLSNTGVFMSATAHPDDEDNGLLVMLNRGRGVRTALVSATRGNGGQNEIGPEIFEALAVLRTGELAALHRFDGAEQYFTRAVDFGFSVSIEETFEKWGRDETIGDYVRLIRTIRPDVITGMTPTATGPGQHGHHAASALIAHEAFKLAGDPTKYPDQIREGLRPWQPKKLYFRMGGGGGSSDQAASVTRVDVSEYDPLLGRTYSEIGTQARSMHKCQGQAPLLALPGPVAQIYQLAESSVGGAATATERSLFDGIDTTIAGLVRFAGARPPRELTEGLSVIAGSVQTAQKKFEESDEATLQPLLNGLYATRVLRSRLRALSIDDAARFEIDVRLRQKEREFQEASLIANGIRVEALADDGVVVSGQPVKVNVIVANRGASEVAIKGVKFSGFEGDGACVLTLATAAGRGAAPAAPGSSQTPVSALKKDTVVRCEPTLRIPADARVTEPYWRRQGDAGRYDFDADAPFGLPFRPTPFYVQVTMTLGGNVEVINGLPVEYRYEGSSLSGEKRTELLVVPALSVRLTPEVVIVPEGSGRPTLASRGLPPERVAALGTPGDREIRATVVNASQAAVDTVVRLEVPAGWAAMPAEQPVKMTRQDESRTVRFQLRPPTAAGPGDHHVKATAALGASTFDRGFQVVEYPHIRRQHIYEPARVRLKVVDVKAAPNLTIGYVMGSGDQVPAAIEQVGARLELLSSDALAWGDLTRFDAIVLGIRAYEKRDDLRANNTRLLEYVRDGGTLVVQYNRAVSGVPEFGPFPGRVTNDRVTDENAPVQVLEPANPVFNVPNKITSAAWAGWVQERGLNFFGEKDSRYRDLVQLEDSYPNNKGVKKGALVEATYGRGRWVYVGLGLWRELPAGVDGAYQLLANLISLPRTSPPRSGNAGAR